jgi:hypothetical protein
LLTVKRTTEITVGRRNFIGEGILRPFLCTLPLIACTTVLHDRSLTLTSVIMLAGSGILTYFLAYQFGRVLPRPFELGKLFPQIG